MIPWAGSGRTRGARHVQKDGTRGHLTRPYADRTEAHAQRVGTPLDRPIKEEYADTTKSNRYSMIPTRVARHFRILCAQ